MAKNKKCKDKSHGECSVKRDETCCKTDKYTNKGEESCK